MNSSLPDRLPLEVLHGIRNVAIRTRNPGVLQRVIKQFSCGSYERPPLAIFLVSRLLTHQEHSGRPVTFTENSLDGVFPERTGATFLRCFARDCEIIRPWNLRAFCHLEKSPFILSDRAARRIWTAPACLVKRNCAPAVGDAILTSFSSCPRRQLQALRARYPASPSSRVQVNAVAPGPVWTPLIPTTLPAERTRNFGADTLFGRAAQRRDGAHICVSGE
jgi:hypothetical protein